MGNPASSALPSTPHQISILYVFEQRHRQYVQLRLLRWRWRWSSRRLSTAASLMTTWATPISSPTQLQPASRPVPSSAELLDTSSSTSRLWRAPAFALSIPSTAARPTLPTPATLRRRSLSISPPAPYPQGGPPYPSSHSPQPPQPQYGDNRQQVQPGAPGEQIGPNGERGFGATLIGSAGGGFLVHQVGGGVLGTMVGGIVGAIGANALEGKHKKKKKEKKDKKHKHSSSGYGGSSYGGSSYGGSAVGGLYPQAHGHHGHHRHHSRSRSRGGGSSSSSSSSDSD